MSDRPPGPHRRIAALLRVAVLGIPALAILIAALLVLGPGRAQPSVGAKVWGVPAEGTNHLALRVHVLDQYAGMLQNHGERDLRIELFDTPTAPWNGRSDADGVADATLESEVPLVGEVQIRVTSGGHLLAHERIMLRPIRNRLVPRQPIPGVAKGDLQIEVTLPRGAMSTPFPEQVVAIVRDGAGEPVPHATIVGEGAGVEVTPARVSTDQQGRAKLTVTVRTLNPELSLRATSASAPDHEPGDDDSKAASGEWSGHLPAVPGSIWLKPIDAAQGSVELHFTSPTPRTHAYLSLVSNRGRESGQLVLFTERRGFYEGTVALALPEADWLAATISPGPYEQSDATVTWPVSALDGQPELQHLDLLIDGMPAAARLEVARTWAVRRSALSVLAMAALLEILLLMLRSRAAERELEAHITRVNEQADDADAPILVSNLVVRRSNGALTVLFAILVALGFAIVGALAYLE